MKLTREKALELHYQMWSDMQNDLGDDPGANEREVYKSKWIGEHFPGQKVAFDCFLCEYTHKSILSNDACVNCPIEWKSLSEEDYENGGRCFFSYKNTEWSIYLTAPISEILALPVKEES